MTLSRRSFLIAAPAFIAVSRLDFGVPKAPPSLILPSPPHIDVIQRLFLNLPLEVNVDANRLIPNPRYR